MTQKELMLSGQLYIADDKELKVNFCYAKELTRKINATTEKELEYRGKLIKQLFKSVGDNVYIEPPFRCDYGKNITIGHNFYANYDCIILDVCDVIIGNNVFFAPRVSLYSAAHPIDAEIRNSKLEYGKKIVIGDNVWLGGNVIVNPGVTIGNNVVIGSGSVVTKDIPSDVIAVGNPCKVLRKITKEDKQYWQHLAEKYYQNIEK